MQMSKFLEVRLEDVWPTNPTPWYRRPWAILQGTRVSMAVSTLVAVLLVVDCFLKTSYLDASLGIRFITGIFSCTWAQGFWVTRRPAARTALHCMATVAAELEATANPETQVLLQRAAARCHLLHRVVAVYAVMVVVSVLLPTLLFGLPSMPSWPRPTNTATLLPVLAIQVVTGTCCPIAFYSLLGMIGALQIACTALYHGTGSAVEEARGEAALRAAARQHVLLSEATLRLDALTADIIVFLMAAVLLLPMQGTYDAVQGRIDAYLLSSAPIILVVLVPLSFTGQGLSDASEQVGDRAYCGGWPAEPPRARYIVNMMMVRATRPAQFTCRGLGAIGLPACESVLKSWFSYLQMLLNVTSKDRRTLDQLTK